MEEQPVADRGDPDPAPEQAAFAGDHAASLERLPDRRRQQPFLERQVPAEDVAKIPRDPAGVALEDPAMGLGRDRDESIVQGAQRPEKVGQPVVGIGHGSGALRASGMVRQWTPPPQRTNWSISTSISSKPRRRSSPLIRVSPAGATTRRPPRLSRLASRRSTSSGRGRDQLDAETGHASRRIRARASPGRPRRNRSTPR